jgi:hypothetical protein
MTEKAVKVRIGCKSHKRLKKTVNLSVSLQLFMAFTAVSNCLQLLIIFTVILRLLRPNMSIFTALSLQLHSLCVANLYGFTAVNVIKYFAFMIVIAVNICKL